MRILHRRVWKQVRLIALRLQSVHLFGTLHVHTYTLIHHWAIRPELTFRLVGNSASSTVLQTHRHIHSRACAAVVADGGVNRFDYHPQSPFFKKHVYPLPVWNIDVFTSFIQITLRDIKMCVNIRMKYSFVPQIAFSYFKIFTLFCFPPPCWQNRLTSAHFHLSHHIKMSEVKIM